MADTPAQVRPVVRPLLATERLSEAVSPLPPVDEIPGGAAASSPFCTVPSSRIAPLELTAPESTCAMAASAFVLLELNASQAVRTATGVVPDPSPLGVQLLSINPGWTIISPVLA